MSESTDEERAAYAAQLLSDFKKPSEVRAATEFVMHFYALSPEQQYQEEDLTHFALEVLGTGIFDQLVETARPSCDLLNGRHVIPHKGCILR